MDRRRLSFEIRSGQVGSDRKDVGEGYGNELMYRCGRPEFRLDRRALAARQTHQCGRLRRIGRGGHVASCNLGRGEHGQKGLRCLERLRWRRRRLCLATAATWSITSRTRMSRRITAGGSRSHRVRSLRGKIRISRPSAHTAIESRPATRLLFLRRAGLMYHAHNLYARIGPWFSRLTLKTAASIPGRLRTRAPGGSKTGTAGRSCPCLRTAATRLLSGPLITSTLCVTWQLTIFLWSWNCFRPTAITITGI